MTTPGARTSLRTNRVCLALVLTATLALAVFHYAQFRSDPRPLWNGIVHDRSGHYQFAQELALAVRSANPIAFFGTLEKAKVWPPLHGLCAAAVLAVGGIDYRLAVLPSLLGFIATTAFGFLLARRCSASSGNVAGVIAYAAFHHIGERISSNPQFSRSREWSLPHHACTISTWIRK